MGRCRVIGNSPGQGPSPIDAQVKLDTVNTANPGWNVMIQRCDREETVYQSPVATSDALVAAFTPLFPHYLVLSF